MSELIEQFKEKVEEQIQDLIDRADEAADDAEDYLDRATVIDHAKINRDPRAYVPLDDLPYGEERARLDGSPDALRDVAEQLRAIKVNDVSITSLQRVIGEAEEKINEVRSTIEDCTPLPDDADEDDEPA